VRPCRTLDIVSGEQWILRNVGIGEVEDHLIRPASLIEGSVGTSDVDRTCGIGAQTCSVVDEGFSAIHCAVSGIINALADAAPEGIVLIMHRFCHNVFGPSESDCGELVGVVPRVFGFDSGGDIGFACLVAFEIVRVIRCTRFRFLPPLVASAKALSRINQLKQKFWSKPNS